MIAVRFGKLVVGGGHRALPALPLLAVAVGHQREDLRGVGEAIEPQGEADADAHREPLSQRAGRDLDARRPGHVRMALQMGADLAKPHQVVGREVAVLGERGVLDRRGVALGEDEAVALRPLRVGGIVAEHPVVEGGDDVGGRERAVEVARLGDGEHADAVDAEHGGVALELGDRGLAPGLGGGLRLGVWNGLQVRHRRLVMRLVVRDGLGLRLAQDRAARVAAGSTSGDLRKRSRRNPRHLASRS